MATPKQLYRNLIEEHPLPWCWACGRCNEPWDKPDDWWGPWWVERAHIVNKPRVLDRRLVVLLCSLCHRTAQGERIVVAERAGNGPTPKFWPALELRHLLYIKATCDPEFYDRKFLQEHSVRRLPRAQQPPACYVLEYARRHE